jgi:hypothetical protein
MGGRKVSIPRPKKQLKEEDMKIIEALKGIKDLQRKAEDLKDKVKKNCSHLSNEKPVYVNQKQQIDSWIQAYNDVVKEILKLQVAIQKTNLDTQVTITLNDTNVTKSIAEWIHRRRSLAGLQEAIYRNLTDRGLREGTIKQSNDERIDVHIVRYFDPAERDKNIDIYSNEPHVIDAKLEIVNATTDLVE